MDLDNLFEYYEEREEHTAKMAVKALEKQKEIDEDETTVSQDRVTWANLRNDEKRCKIICGFTPDEFLTLYGIIEEHLPENVGRGRRCTIPKRDKLVMVLCYLKHYESLDKMKDGFLISKSCLHNILKGTINIITPILYEYFVVNLQDRVEKENESEEEMKFPNAKFVMDATFQPIWTPKTEFKEKKQYYSGKHHMYGLKSQCIHDRKGRLVNCISGEKGSVHDFTICKNNVEVLKNILMKEQAGDDLSEELPEDESWGVLADSGYQGLQTLVNATLPKKRTAKKALTKEQKEFNKTLASERVICERFYGRLKTKFRIMSSKYRNERDEYETMFKLCCALTNFDILEHPL